MSMRTKDKKRFNEPLRSTFLNTEKDLETICQRIFLYNKEFGDYIKRLLVLNTEDCIDDLESEIYKKKIEECSLSYLKENQYIRIVPKLKFEENPEVKSYLLMSIDNYKPCINNKYFRECSIMIDIICNTEYWDLGGFRLRPYKIAGYVDAVLNQARLSGLGTLEFRSCDKIVFNENLSGLCLMYRTVHGNDDFLTQEDEE